MRKGEDEGAEGEDEVPEIYYNNNNNDNDVRNGYLI